eukprot:GHVT01045004.1.p2 GENE.GHVT01045004.1~~GHVT01045004.1.p2  ORF type:complete len:122 (+),score=8.39 GHVT01045004.1:1710-2075(+)
MPSLSPSAKFFTAVMIGGILSSLACFTASYVAFSKVQRTEIGKINQTTNDGKVALLPGKNESPTSSVQPPGGRQFVAQQTSLEKRDINSTNPEAVGGTETNGPHKPSNYRTVVSLSPSDDE